MLLKFRFFFCAILFLASCRSKENKQTIEDALSPAVIPQSYALDLQNKYTDYVLDASAKPLVSDWAAYHNLEAVVELLKAGDFSPLINNKDILKTYFKELIESIPEELKTPAITARIKAFETHLFLLENTIEVDPKNETLIIKSLEAVFKSHADLKFQINKLVERKAQDVTN